MALWVVLEVLWLETKKCKMRCIGFKGFAIKSLPKTPVLCFGHNLAIRPPNGVILGWDEI